MLGKIIKAAIALAITSTFIGGIVAGSFRTMIGASFWRTVAANTVLLGLNYLTTKGSNNTTARNLGTPQAFTNPIAARNTVYGKTRVGGTIVYRDVTLSTKELRQIIAVAAHEINDIKKIFLNNGNETFELSLTTDFSESSGVYTITNTNFVNSDNDDAYGSGGLVKVIYEKGDQTTVNSAIQTELGSSTWTNDHKLQGIAYIYISCIFDADKWKGYPTFSFEVEGKKVYDPRTSTTVYSTNPALIIRDYLKDTTYGFGAFDSEINDDTTGAGFIKAANDCDDDITLTAGTEDRYTLNGEYTASEEPQKVLETMLSSCAGQLSYNNGKFNLFVGKERTASGTITDDKLLAPVQITTKASATSLVNGVKASYVNPSNKYQATEIRPYQDSTYLTEDTPSGEASANYEKFMNLSFPYTHTTTTAQRLARIALDYARQDQVLSVVVPIEFMTHQVGDIINLTNDRLGYSGKDFEITSMSFEFIEDNYLALRINLKEYSTTVFDNITYTADPTLPDDLDAGDNTVPVPTGLTLTEITKTPSFGDVAKQFYIRANWTNASDEKIAATEVAYKKSTDTVFVAKSVAYGTTRIIESAESDTTYNFKVRHISAEGVAGDYTSVVNITTSSSQGTHSGGTVGGVTVGTDKLYIGTGTFDNANTPFYVDDTGQFSLKDKLSWNGTTLDISGNLTVENTITADKIVVDGINLDDILSSTDQATNNYLTTFSGAINISSGGALAGYPAMLQLQATNYTNAIGEIRQAQAQLNIRARNNNSNGGIEFQGYDGSNLTPYGGFDASGNFEMNRVDVISSARQLQNIASLDSTTTTTIQNAVSAGSGTTINNNADNRVITGSNTADTLNGEANLTFDGSTLGVTGAITASGNGQFTGSFLYTSGDLRIGTSTGATNQTGIIKHNGTTYGLGLFNWGDANPIFIGGSEVNFRTETGSAIALKSNGTTFLDASRNLTNIGTISSGAITTTGNYTLQKNIPMIRFISADGSSNSYSISGNINNTVDGGFYIQEGTTNGTNVRLSIDATGDVGIGKINASQKLDVQGNIGISGTEVIDISRNLTNIASITANNGITQVSGSNQIDLTTDGSIEITRGAGGAYIDFKDSASEDYDQRLASTSAGFNLGNLITETNTNKNSLINDWVTVGTGSRGGALKINDIAGANYAIRCGSYDLTFYKDVSGTSWSEVMRFDGNSASNSSVDVVIANSLGIGKTPSTWHLDVDSSSVYVASFDGSNNTGVVINSGSTSIADIIGYSNSASTYNALNIRSASGTGLYINTSNSVGIGTSSPRHKLSVNGTLGSSTFSGFGMGVIGGLATAESGNTNRAIGIQSHATSNAKFFAYDYGASAGIPISIQPDNADVYLCAGGGEVGIGTTNPTSALDVRGNVGAGGILRLIDSNSTECSIGYKIGGATGNVGWVAGNYNNDFFIYSYSLGAQAMTIQPTGEVGINNANPPQKLTVNGNIGVGGTEVIDSSRQLRNTRLLTTSSSTHQIDSQQGNSAFNDTLFLRNTTSGGHMRLGMSSNDSDGQHHRVTLRAQKGSGTYEGELVMQIRATGGGFNDRFLFGSTGDLHADGNVVAYSTSVSDKKFKDNVVNLNNSLDKVLQLRGVEFDWNATTRKGTHDVGLIAQEVEAVVPEVVTEHEIKIGEFADNPITSKTVAYDKLVPLLVEAIKEQQKQIDELKAKLK